MNYIRELNAFYDWLETNPLNHQCIALWHALMHTNSKAGWKKEFTVAVITLELKTGLNRRAIERARNTLEQVGLIRWRKRSGNQSAIYEMIPLSEKFVRQNDIQTVAQSDAQTDVQSVAQTVAQSDAQSVAINKLNKTKLNKTETTSTNPYRLFESEGFGTISSFVAENIQDMIDTYGEVWVCEAMREAVLQGKRKLSYVRGILKSWAADGMRRSSEKQEPKSSIDYEIELQRRMRDRNEQPIDWFAAK